MKLMQNEKALESRDVKGVEGLKRLAARSAVDDSTLYCFTTSCSHTKHLPSLVVTAWGTNGVRRHTAAALGAFIQLRSMPAISRFARA